MTTFFNEELLERLSNNDPFKYIALLDYHVTGKLPRSTSKYRPARVSLIGRSFLLNPGPLLNLKSCDIYHIVQYVKLAAKRDYSWYKLYGSTGIDLLYFPELDKAAVRNNPLLSVTNSHVNFKFER